MPYYEILRPLFLRTDLQNFWLRISRYVPCIRLINNKYGTPLINRIESNRTLLYVEWIVLNCDWSRAALRMDLLVLVYCNTKTSYRCHAVLKNTQWKTKIYNYNFLKFLAKSPTLFSPISKDFLFHAKFQIFSYKALWALDKNLFPGLNRIN